MHIGLIGGIGPAATVFYYERLGRAAAAATDMDLTIVEARLTTLLGNLQTGDRTAQAVEFSKLTDRLAAAGADCAVITSLAGHFCINELAGLSCLPLVSALPALNAHFRTEGLTKVGLLGTSTVMGSGLYRGITGCDLLVPLGADFDATHEGYLALASRGKASPEDAAFFHEMGRKMVRDQGAQAIALAGTDLFLAFGGQELAYPVIDCAEVHVNAIIEAAGNSPAAAPPRSR